jgi:hypothetical protein
MISWAMAVSGERNSTISWYRAGGYGLIFAKSRNGKAKISSERYMMPKHLKHLHGGARKVRIDKITHSDQPAGSG